MHLTSFRISDNKFKLVNVAREEEGRRRHVGNESKKQWETGNCTPSQGC